MLKAIDLFHIKLHQLWIFDALSGFFHHSKASFMSFFWYFWLTFQNKLKAIRIILDLDGGYNLQIYLLSFKWMFVNKKWVDLQAIRMGDSAYQFHDQHFRRNSRKAIPLKELLKTNQEKSLVSMVIMWVCQLVLFWSSARTEGCIQKRSISNWILQN